MTHLTTEQLQAIQTKADSMLDAIIERLEGSTQLQAALRHVMQDSGDALSAFEQLATDEPAVANQVLFSAVGALANLQTTRAAKSELKRRAESGRSFGTNCRRPCRQTIRSLRTPVPSAHLEPGSRLPCSWVKTENCHTPPWPNATVSLSSGRRLVMFLINPADPRSISACEVLWIVCTAATRSIVPSRTRRGPAS